MHPRRPHKGFIALISAIIISVILLGLATAVGSNTFFSRFNALNREYKRISLGLAESCVHAALSKIGNDFDYVVGPADPDYSASRGGVVVDLDTVYGRDVDCVITAPTTAPTEVDGKKVFNIATKASFSNAFSSLTVSATAQDPDEAPVVPPPTCTLTASPSSIPLGQSVQFLWSTSSNADSFFIDHGIGYVGLSGPPWVSVTPTGIGSVTYVGTVHNTGGDTHCETTITVTAPPPAPACADTVMMLDRSYSMFGYPNYPSGYNQWIPNEKAAGKALVDLYAGVASAPKVGFGRIADTDDGHGADLVTMLTSSYNTIKNAIDNGFPSNPIGYTNLGEAINVGHAELESVRHDPDKDKILIFVSDGEPNEPTSGVSGNTGWKAPGAHSANNSLTGDAWTNPANAYSAGTTTDALAHRHRYQNFTFNVPGSATIEGIEVQASAASTAGAPVTLFTDNFGTGASVNDIPNWEEQGNDSDATTLALAAGSGNDSASPDGGRFARIGQDEWICRNVNATGLSNMALSFYWRGDSDAESSDDMIVEYNANGSDCNTGSGWNALASDNLNGFTSSWSGRQSANLPTSLNNDNSFLVRFRVDSNNSNEELRIDGVTLTSTPPACQLGVDLSWNGGGTWTTENLQTLTPTLATYTYGGSTNTWGRTWNTNDFSDGNFRLRIHATPTGATCAVDTLTARVSYEVPTTPSQFALDAATDAKADGVKIFSIHFGDVSGQNFMAQLASPSTLGSVSIASASRSGNTVTITTSAPHKAVANERVQITGVSNNTFNGTFTVTSVVNASSFRYTTSGSGTASGTGGSVLHTNLYISPSTGSMTDIFRSIGAQVCPAAAPQCSNTVDDDGNDGNLIDDADPGCHTDGNAANLASYDPNDNDEWNAPPVTPAPPPPPPPPTISIGSWVEN